MYIGYHDPSNVALQIICSIIIWVHEVLVNRITGTYHKINIAIVAHVAFRGSGRDQLNRSSPALSAEVMAILLLQLISSLSSGNWRLIRPFGSYGSRPRYAGVQLQRVANLLFSTIFSLKTYTCYKEFVY